MEACKGMYQLSFQQPAPAKWLEQSARKAFDKRFTRLLLMVPWVSGACPGLCPGHVRGMSGMSGACPGCPGRVRYPVFEMSWAVSCERSAWLQSVIPVVSKEMHAS